MDWTLPDRRRSAASRAVFWGLFTSVMFICTFALNVHATTSKFEFCALTLILLAGGVKNENIEAGGWVGLIAAALAFLLGSIEIVNDVLGGEKEWRVCSEERIMLIN